MKKKHIASVIVLVAIVFGASFFIAKNFQIQKTPSSQTALPITIIPPTPQNTTLYFVGDIMLDRAVKTSVTKNFGGDYSKLFANVGELAQSDILFANLEGDVSDTGNNVGSIYSFRMNPIVLPAIKQAGFDIVSFANNHVGDWNMAAFKDSLARLADNGILKTGAGFTKSEAETPTIIEKNGTKFGFIGFSDVGPNWLAATDTTPGILLATDPRLPTIVANAKKQVDVLIVSFHWGIEYKTVHNARQETLAHTAIDNGADMVIGHHPHVMEDIETYNGHPIVYSLGNFIFDQYFSKDTMHGMVFEATFQGKNIIDTKHKVVELNPFYQPKGIYDAAQDPTTDQAKSNACPKPTKQYADYSYLNVGQDVPIPDKTYVPADLVLLDKSISTTSICLSKQAADPLVEMIAGAKKDGYTLKVSSGYRSYATQKTILANDIASGNPEATRLVAKPGYSEHQLGMAVDLTSPSISNASATGKFADTKEAIWLQDNAYKYGFIESYPEGKETITGYDYEAWHYRYVNPDNAAEIIKSGQTINQYLTQKKEEKIAEEKKN
jgi:LAS superfamily LD-carboxypeptidase LdcB/poly-gamma-glutamate capsule biosynthesis protein CapA/YwtB (metallophosphatase superfamily)